MTKKIRHKVKRWIPATKDAQGYHVSPRSTCCGSSCVSWDSANNLYLVWAGYQSEAIPDELRCKRCNAKLSPPDTVSGNHETQAS